MEASGQWLRWRRAALEAALAAHQFEFARNPGDAVLHAAAVGFQLRFAFAAAHADAARLPRQVAPEPRQPRQQMLQLREFDLQLAFARAGALREDVENQRRAVQDLAVEYFLQIAALGGRKFVVENDRVHVVPPAEGGKFLRLALADERGRRGSLQLLHPVADDFAAGGGGQFAEFGERVARVHAVARFEFDANEEDPFRPRFSGFDKRFQRRAIIPQIRVPAPQQALLFVAIAVSSAPMKTFLLLMMPILCGLALPVGVATAQPLPAIALKPVFPALQDERPLWMSEAPDGSGRFFIVYQVGKILIVKKGSDGSDAKEFLNIEDRHPYFENEDGLLSIAFHPGFKTNGLFYIYYKQQNTPEEVKRFQDGRPTSFPYRSVISEFKVSATDPDKADMTSERILFERAAAVLESQGRRTGFRSGRLSLSRSRRRRCWRTTLLAAARTPRRCSPKCCALT